MEVGTRDLRLEVPTEPKKEGSGRGVGSAERR